MVTVLQRGHWMPNFHSVVVSLGSSWNGLSVCVKTLFLPCQKQLCSQRLVSMHISLHANDHCYHATLFCGNDHPWVLTKPALNCPSFRKQYGVKWFAQPGINEFSESELMCGQVWCPRLKICALHLTHPSTQTVVTHTHREHTPGVVGSHIAAATGSSCGFDALLKGLTSVVVLKVEESAG